jgi:regulator of replication initiation timing
MPRPTTHNRGTRRSEAESDLGEVLAMADPDLAFYVESNEALRLRNEALLERVAKLEEALELIAEHARLDKLERQIAEAVRYEGIARVALDG